MDVRQKAIVLQNANNAAAAAVTANEWDPAFYFEIRDQIFENTWSRIAEFEAQEAGTNIVQGAFPGAVASELQVPGRQDALRPNAQPIAPPSVGLAPVAGVGLVCDSPAPVALAPAPFPGASNPSAGDDAVWQKLFADFEQGRHEDWYDNRNNKRTSGTPDFKERGGLKRALWISGKTTPQWAKDRLGVR